MNKVEKTIAAMNPDSETGVSNWITIERLEEISGVSQHGNGCQLLQNDRGVGKFYVVEKQYDGKQVSEVRLTGFAPNHQSERASKIPPKIRKAITKLACSSCGTHHGIECDHKDGNKEPIQNPTIDNFQPLCNHCNFVKRERCKECRKTGERFNAKTLGFNVSWTEGSKKFQAKEPRCKGCYWNSPHDFHGKLHLQYFA